ncbi:MAG: peptide ABC transporter permease [Candidatus Chloroheliales bacterium]|nr:MAG: peptide ABC transporter permease [Chloroflexota bacterium]
MAVATTLDREQISTAKEETQLSVIWRRFRKHKLAVVGLGILCTLGALALTAQFWTPYDPTVPGFNAGVQSFASPGYVNPNNGNVYIMGTDNIGRDVLSRLAYGGQVSLSVGLLCTLLVAMIGTIVGSIAGFFGGFVDALLMRIVDLVLSLPFLPMLLALSVVLGPGYWTIVIILTLFGWPGTSRLVRGSVLSLRNLDFVEATRALGASNTRIITRHLLPNSLAPIIVDATLNVGGFIVAESSVSFLGFGISEPTSSWGNILAGLEDVARQAPLQLIWPGLLIFLTVLSINFIGDALRDALDPRLKM